MVGRAANRWSLSMPAARLLPMATRVLDAFLRFVNIEVASGIVPRITDNKALLWARAWYLQQLNLWTNHRRYRDEKSALCNRAAVAAAV
jgi:hypothetical protein